MPLYLLLLNQIIASYSLSITSVYVIVDPLSTSKNPVIQLKDSYSYDEQQIGYINEHLLCLSVYMKGSSSTPNSWFKMQANQQGTGSYSISHNHTFNKPLSLKLTFSEEPTTNYTWNSFLFNLDGTTIYHLYINKKTTSSPTSSSTASSNSTLLASIQHNDEYVLPQENINNNALVFDQLFISLVIVSTVCIVMCVCCISVCCCFYFYRNMHANNSKQTPHKPPPVPTAAAPPPPPPPPIEYVSSLRINPLAQNIEGCKEESLQKSMIELVQIVHKNDADLQSEKPENVNNNSNSPKVALLENIGNKLKSVMSMSLRKLSKSSSCCDDDIVLRPESKARTSISLYKKSYSLSMDQVNQLKHGSAVQTVDGVCIKVDEKTNQQQKYCKLPADTVRNVKSMAMDDEYNYNQYQYTGDEYGSDNEDEESRESSTSHESMYNYQENGNDTDDGSNKDFEVLVVKNYMIRLSEEGL